MPLCSSIHDCKSYIFMRTLLVLLLFGSTALCRSIIKTLPGFPGILPFKLETGYINVGSSELFYCFVESQGNPSKDPLILHQLGGPGCSGLNGFFRQIGNRIGQKPFINLKGYYVGSPHTDSDIEENSRIPYVYGVGLISHDLYERAKESCGGNDVHVDATNTNCLNGLAKINQCIKHINGQHILRTNCETHLVKSKNDNQIQARRSTKEMSVCVEDIPDLALENWANNKRVQDALQVRKGAYEKWYRCNFENIREGTYKYDVKSAIGHHKNLTNSSIEVLVYIGDHEYAVPHISAEQWIKSLNLTVHSDWRPWYTADQVAGYTMTYKKFNYRLTYATVKGAGHSPTQYKRKECYAMIQSWMNYSPL